MNNLYIPVQSYNSRKNRDSIQRKRVFRLMFVVTIMLISFIFGAMIHAYAYGNSEHNVDRVAISEPGFDRSESFVSQNQTTVTVEQGDTLWSIASKYVSKHTDIRSFIAAIKNVNDLHDSRIQEGQVIVIP